MGGSTSADDGWMGEIGSEKDNWLEILEKQLYHPAEEFRDSEQPWLERGEKAVPKKCKG